MSELLADVPAIQSIKRVYLGELTFWVRELTGTDLDEYQIEVARRDGVAPRATFLAFALSDGQGARLYGPADIDAIGARPGWMIDALFDAAWEHNRMAQVLGGDLAETRKSVEGETPGSGMAAMGHGAGEKRARSEGQLHGVRAVGADGLLADHER